MFSRIQLKMSIETTSGITGSLDAQDKTLGEKDISDVLGLALGMKSKKAGYPDMHCTRRKIIVGNKTTLIIESMYYRRHA